jgi:hypothetical protein
MNLRALLSKLAQRLGAAALGRPGRHRVAHRSRTDSPRRAPRRCCSRGRSAMRSRARRSRWVRPISASSFFAAGIPVARSGDCREVLTLARMAAAQSLVSLAPPRRSGRSRAARDRLAADRAADRRCHQLAVRGAILLAICGAAAWLNRKLAANAARSAAGSLPIAWLARPPSACIRRVSPIPRCSFIPGGARPTEQRPRDIF